MANWHVAEAVVFWGEVLFFVALLPGIVLIATDGSWEAVKSVLALFGLAYLWKLGYDFAGEQARERREKKEGAAAIRKFDEWPLATAVKGEWSVACCFAGVVVSQGAGAEVIS